MASTSPKWVPLMISLSFRNRKKLQGARSGEYGGCSCRVMFFFDQVLSDALGCVIMMKDPKLVFPHFFLFGLLKANVSVFFCTHAVACLTQ